MSDHDVRYPPIGDYGMIGDLRSAALLSKQGSIDWMCLPRFDSPWIFGRLLDWDKGGYLQLCPVGGALMYRQYRRDSNVIQSVWGGDRARMRVVDWMPIAVKNKRRRPPESLRLIRMMQPIAGTTDWRLTFKPRFDYGRQVPVLTIIRPGMVMADGADGSVFLQYPAEVPVELTDGVAIVTGRVMPGHRAAVSLHYTKRGAKPPASVSVDDAHTYLHQTDDYWIDWVRSSTYKGRFDEPLHRSALALKLMQYVSTGAFVAAPTTSLPESPGGSLNWDYRYTWIRDTADLVNALHQLGFEDEVDGFLRWVRRAHDRHPERYQIMYTIDADDRLPEYVLDDLEGYRGSKPVRIGNAAAEQVQLDIYGELIQTAYTAFQSRKELPRPRREIFLGIVDYILEHWQSEDSGIWESRRRPRRYLYSQVMLWVGLDRALKLDRALRMGKTRRAAVTRTRDAIKREVLELGYDREIGAFTQALGHKELDCAALAVAMYEMLPVTDPRVVSTVKVLQERLSNKGFLYRYLPEESEFQQPEGAFIVCTLWMVNVLAQMGRLEEAEALFSRVTESANDLGLFGEEFDPDTGELLGNFPQALTHLSVINAAFNLEGRPSGKGRRSGRRDGG
jgi:GH15 family glucan-1,4-alpha-glucosidase